MANKQFSDLPSAASGIDPTAIVPIEMGGVTLQTTAAAIAALATGTGTVTHTGTLTADEVVVGNGGVDIKALAAGTDGDVLTRVSGSPAWAAATGGGTVTHTGGALTAGLVAVGAGGADLGVLAAGTDGYVLTQVSGVAAWAAGGGGGLADFTDTYYSSSPNGSVNVAALAASGGATDIAIAWVWKGSGYLTAQVPDGSSTGGNVRGTGAVDLQTSRTVAANVASGTRSALIATSDAKASGAESAGVATDRGVATGDQSLVTGLRGVADGDNSVVMGHLGTADGVTGAFVRGSPGNNALGERQVAYYQLRGDIIFSSSPKILKVNNSMIPLLTAAGKLAAFLAHITMQVTGGDKLYATIQGLIARDSNAASTAFVGSPIITYIARTAGAISNWTVDAVADTSAGGLNIECIDAAGASVVVCTCDIEWRVSSV